MDFVTITDHDTIDGCLELADRPDCFVSEELTAELNRPSPTPTSAGRARRTHERRLRAAIADGSAAASRGDIGAAFGSLF
jgi:hypothetical protein